MVDAFAIRKSDEEPVVVKKVEVVALVIVPLVAKRLVAVSPEDEAFPSTVCPDTVRAVAEAVAKVV